jgi:hypothetical protein
MRTDPAIDKAMRALDQMQTQREQSRAEEALAAPQVAVAAPPSTGSDAWWFQLDNEWSGLFSGRRRTLETRMRDIRLGVPSIRRDGALAPPRDRPTSGRSVRSDAANNREALAAFEQRLRARLAIAEQVVAEHERSGRQIDVNRIQW